MTGQEWKPVRGYEGAYEVSNDGKVRSVDRVDARGWKRKGRPMSDSRHEHGYRQVGLSKNGRQRMFRVHILVLEAFVGPRPEGLVACHENGNPADNRLENLRWDTLSSNSLDRTKHGTCKESRKTHCAKGHPYDDENTGRSNGQRYCRTCKRARRAESRNRGGVQLSRQEWQEALFPLIARAAKLDPIAYEYHPAYRGLLSRIDALIEHGLQHEYITTREAYTL